MGIRKRVSSYITLERKKETNKQTVKEEKSVLIVLIE